MKKWACVLIYLAIFLSCKKDKLELPDNSLSNEVVIITSENYFEGSGGRLHIYAFLSDLQGNVLDFSPIAAGTTTTLSTGDPSILHFDFHYAVRMEGQYNSIYTTHHIKGDTIWLSRNFIYSYQPKKHSTVTITGLNEAPDEIVCEGSDVDIVSVDVSIAEIKCQIESESTDPRMLYMVYGNEGDNLYRYYWNDQIPMGSDIIVENSELPQIPPIQTMSLPQGFNLLYLNVWGVPQKANESILLFETNRDGTNIPFFIPADFASNIVTEIALKSSGYDYATTFRTDNIPATYVPPMTEYTFNTSNLGVDFSISGSDFDTYYIEFYGQYHLFNWKVSGPFENKLFTFPILPDSIATLIKADPFQIEGLTIWQWVTKYTPSIPFELWPTNIDSLYERRDVVYK